MDVFGHLNQLSRGGSIAQRADDPVENAHRHLVHPQVLGRRFGAHSEAAQDLAPVSVMHRAELGEDDVARSKAA